MDNTTRLSGPSKRDDIDEIHRHFPKHTYDEVADALDDCRLDSGTKSDYNRILQCIKSRLAPQGGDGLD